MSRGENHRTGSDDRRPDSPAVIVVHPGETHGCAVQRHCAQVRLLLSRGCGGVVVCDVEALTEPDLTAVDGLARMQVTARRLGGEVQLRNAPPALLELLCLSGLAVTLPCETDQP